MRAPPLNPGSLFIMYTITTTKYAKHKFRNMNYLQALIGFSFVFLLPVLHFGIINDFAFNIDNSQQDEEVDREKCRNTCWDAKFKGTYETMKKPTKYKHIYFNCTSNTTQIWLLTLIFALALYEIVKHIVCLSAKGKLRFTMFFLLCSVIYSHYYTWWVFFNYLNDDFYKQWYHQLFFSSTELISSACIVYLLNKDNPLNRTLLLTILNIALFHIIVSLKDQSFEQIFTQQGEFYQQIRDVGFMVPDVLHVMVAYHALYLKRAAFDIRKEIMISLSGIGVLSLVGIVVLAEVE